MAATYETPAWVDREKYLAMGENSRWNSVQGLCAMMGIENQATIMAIARGIPNRPPAWLIAMPIEGEAIRLEQEAAADVARITKDEQDRYELTKLCQHEFGQPSSTGTRACIKCGHVPA